MSAPAKNTLGLSVIVPVFNEEDTLEELGRRVGDVLRDGDYELLFVDDGSTDGSAAVLNRLRLEDPRVRVVRFARNLGKSQALAVAFREARGRIIITIDADLQDDPAEIPRLVAALEQGYDLVNGWKKHRQDPPSKRIPSRIFNWVTSFLTGLHLMDFNSGFKAYRRQVIDSLQVYGEQHRYIPVLAYWKGFRVGEIPVAHQPRRFGKSKFGAERFLAGLFDLFTVLFLMRFQRKPLHLFGLVGLAFLAVGLVINGYLTVIWLGGESIGTRPLLQLGVLLMVMGVQFLSLGLLGEMVAQGTARQHPQGHVYRVFEGQREVEVGLGSRDTSPEETAAPADETSLPGRPR